jgi:hypothetical protein
MSILNVLVLYGHEVLVFLRFLGTRLFLFDVFASRDALQPRHRQPDSLGSFQKQLSAYKKPVAAIVLHGSCLRRREKGTGGEWVQES